jgi:endonuclease YncB( thermonuclease family)
VWPGQSITVYVRVRGIDAPEVRSRCDSERRAAALARDALAELMAGGTVSISNIAGAKYYGRVLADVSSGGSGVAEAMLARGLVRVYSGGRRRSWCE